MHKDYNWELITGRALRWWICDLTLARPAGGPDVRLSPTSSATVWRYTPFPSHVEMDTSDVQAPGFLSFSFKSINGKRDSLGFI